MHHRGPNRLPDHPALAATPDTEADPVAGGPSPASPSAGLLRLLIGFVGRNRRAYLLSALMLAGVALLTAWVPREVGRTVDVLAAGDASTGWLAGELAFLVALGVGIYLLRVGWRITLYGAAYRLGVELRTRLFARLSGHGPRFFQRRRTGDLMALATIDVDAVEMAAGEAFLAGFDGTLTLVVVIAMMSLGLDWRLTLVALLPFPLMAVSFWLISRRVHAASRRSLEAFSRLNEHTQQTIAGVRTLRALGLETPVHREFAQRAKLAADHGFDALRWESAYEPAVSVTMSSAVVLVLGVGGWLFLRGELTIGELTAFTMYLGQLIWPMFALGWVLSLIERGRAAWERLEPILAEPDDIADDGRETRVPGGDLVFEHVGFSYPGQREPALQAIDLRIEPGRTIGIVGATGSGKSTLVSLLLRQYAPDRGRICWGGTPLADYRLEALRRAIAWVPQEAFLFSDTLAGNIALARPDATPAQIEAAARMADLHDDVMQFPAHYRTPVGERGVTLSGGQRQRVAIARALLADCPLLVLDDALSAVDTGTETRILAHLRDARAQRTAIVITHRLSAVVDADEILVLAAGRVIERGDHASLVALGGWYASQWRYQQLQKSLDGG